MTIAGIAVVTDAERVARSLSARFLQGGNYEALGTALGREAALQYSAAAAEPGFGDDFFTEEGFSGLAVQSVGFTAGAEQEKVIVYVTRGSHKKLSSIEASIDGIEVDVKLIGKLKAGPTLSGRGNGYLFERNGRIACGSSCAPSSESYAGTLGALLRGPDGFYALSNNHVFAACNHTPVGLPILAPSPQDARAGLRAPTGICEHHKIIELRSGDPALVTPMSLDAAIARVSDETLLTSWQGDSQQGYDTPTQAGAPLSGMRVKKFGRTSGLTFGRVEALQPTPWILPYRSGKFTANVWFENTWTVVSEDSDPFSSPGDSGSLVVTEDGQTAIGLVFAGNPKGNYGIICEIAPILSAFANLQLVTGHGV